MRLYLILICGLILSGCRSVSLHQPNLSTQSIADIPLPDRLNWLQRIYIWKYEQYRLKGLKLFDLPESSTLEDFRPHIAQLLGLPEIISISGILAHPQVKKILTEERRVYITVLFRLPENTTWIDIQKYAERIRISKAYKH